jgi:TolB-like protein
VTFFQELKRRNVFRVAVAYILLGWAVLQGADFLLDLAGAPDWVIRVFAVAGLVGLPFALFFAWAFELTPEGIKRESEIDRSQSITPRTGRKLDYFIIGTLGVIIVLMAVERLYFAGRPDGAVTPPEPSTQPQQAAVPAAAPKSIAVLPFTDLSQAQDQAWFADGLAEEILNALVRVPDLSVAARTSSYKFKGSSQSVTEIAAELGVAHVLEGSVRSAGERIRVTAQLIRASDGFHLWSQNYDRAVADMIGIQEDLARNIATALETSMDPEALAQMAAAGTESVEAYQEYLRGLQAVADALNTIDGSARLRQAYEHFEQARAIDPGFFDAHVQAASYWKIELTPSSTDSGTSGLEPPQMLREYNARIGQAIDNARTEADRIRSLADRALVDLRLREARRLFDQYLELRPNDDLSRSELAGVLGMLADGEAFRELLTFWKAKGQTDQFSANSYINEAYRWADPAEAADFALEVIQRWPNSSTLLYQAHRTLLWAGRFREASEVAARYLALVPGGAPLVSGREACASGDRKAAEQILAGLSTDSGQDLSTKWILLNLLGNSAAETEVLRPLEQSGVPYQLATFLAYPKFDARPYPTLMAVLEREGVQRPPPPVPPFRCPPPA